MIWLLNAIVLRLFGVRLERERCSVYANLNWAFPGQRIHMLDSSGKTTRWRFVAQGADGAHLARWRLRPRRGA